MTETFLQQTVRQFEERQFDAAFLRSMGIAPMGGPDATEA
jgi:hypothetical protein